MKELLPAIVLATISILLTLWSSYRTGAFSKKRMKARSRFSLGYFFVLILLFAMATRVYLEYRDYQVLKAYLLQTERYDWLKSDPDSDELVKPVTDEEIEFWKKRFSMVDQFGSATVDARKQATAAFENYQRSLAPPPNPDYASFIVVPTRSGEDNAEFLLNSKQPLRLIVEVVDRDDEVKNAQIIGADTENNESKWTLRVESSADRTLTKQGVADFLTFNIAAGKTRISLSETIVFNGDNDDDFVTSFELAVNKSVILDCSLPRGISGYTDVIANPGAGQNIESPDELPVLCDIRCQSSRYKRYSVRFRLEAVVNE